MRFQAHISYLLAIQSPVALSVRPFRYITAGREFKSYLEIEFFSEVSVLTYFYYYHLILTLVEVKVIQGLFVGRTSYNSS